MWHISWGLNRRFNAAIVHFYTPSPGSSPRSHTCFIHHLQSGSYLALKSWIFFFCCIQCHFILSISASFSDDDDAETASCWATAEVSLGLVPCCLYEGFHPVWYLNMNRNCYIAFHFQEISWLFIHAFDSLNYFNNWSRDEIALLMHYNVASVPHLYLANYLRK